MRPAARILAVTKESASLITLKAPLTANVISVIQEYHVVSYEHEL